MPSLRSLIPVALVAFPAGCNLVPPAPAEPTEASRPAPVAAPLPAPVRTPVIAAAREIASENLAAKRRFGKPIRSNDAVTLAAVAADPKTFNHRSIVTEGTVTKVCQEAGCWMAIKDGAHDALVRMENHAFFLPKDAAGQHARIEGRILLMKDGKECDEAEAEHAQLSMEAVGVELAAN
jgi:hypothetical protein